jgi:hypothetical protein
MDALRALSPAEGLSTAEGLPEIAKTEAWGRRMLNAQLGSWSELRHDTLLYAKQSYTGIPSCEFPDAYVDPYPEFYAAIAKYAEQGNRIAQLAAGAPITDLEPRITAYFSALLDAATKLGAMAEAQRRGEMFSADQMAFINQAVRVIEQSGGCTMAGTPSCSSIETRRSNSTRRSPTCTRSRRMKAATSSAGCCTWARARRATS